MVTPDGTARQVADGLAFPNGLVVTPDNSTPIVVESHANRLTAFDTAADGSLSNQQMWAELDGGAEKLAAQKEVLREAFGASTHP